MSAVINGHARRDYVTSHVSRNHSLLRPRMMGTYCPVRCFGRWRAFPVLRRTRKQGNPSWKEVIYT